MASIFAAMQHSLNSTLLPVQIEILFSFPAARPVLMDASTPPPALNTPVYNAGQMSSVHHRLWKRRKLEHIEHAPVVQMSKKQRR